MPRESTTGSAMAVAPWRPVRFEHRSFSDVVVTGYPGTQGVAVHSAMTGLWASRLGRLEFRPSSLIPRAGFFRPNFVKMFVRPNLILRWPTPYTADISKSRGLRPKG